MEGFENISPMEGGPASLDVRRELREAFARWLPRPHHIRPAQSSDECVDEQALLSLCEHFRLEYPGEAKDLAQSWDESETRKAEGGPLFEELKQQGWVFFDGGRWMIQGIPVGTRSHISYPTPGTQGFLEELSRPQLTPKTDSPPAAVKALEERILAEFWLEKNVPVENPECFLGRLWEQLCPAGLLNSEKEMILQHDQASAATHADAVDCAFREWAAWCRVIQGYGEWSSQWMPEQKQLCREAAHRVLARQTLWGGWDEDLVRYIDVLLNTYGIPQNQVRFAYCTREVIPRTLVAKAGWLTSRGVQYLMMDRLMMHRWDQNMVSFAFGLLCSELEKTDIGPNVLTASEALLSFAANHPMALMQLSIRIDAVSVLLVDLLLYRPTACLAAQWTIMWHTRGRNSERSRSREAQMRTFAVEDALSCIAHYVEADLLSLEECAALITWCYRGDVPMGQDIADTQRSVGHQLLGMITRQNEHVQSEVLRYLVNQVRYKNNVSWACFSGALDGKRHFPQVAEATMLPVVAFYSEFARNLNLDCTDVAMLSPVLAGCLVATACAQDAPVRDAFLIPFDGMALLQEAPQDEQLIVRSSVARTIRVHVRLLARAVSGWPDDEVPPVLSDAFRKLISLSVIEHDEKGRIGALTDRYSPGNSLTQEVGSPAQDLAAAWHKLDKSRQEDLLQVFAQSDDPVLLAELCQHLPATAKAGIKAKLRQLKPGEASDFWTWTELIHRIETLQNAEEYELAREHLDDVRPELDNAPLQSRLALFTLELRLYLKQENWDALDIAVIPSTLRTETARQANDELDFYRATSQLLRPEGNLARARADLKRLAAIPGASTAYRENYFAIAIQQIIGSKTHPISAVDKVAGERLLAEIKSAIKANKLLESTSLLANRALLLIALERPGEALESINQRRNEIRSADLELAAALAKHEMGLWGEAMVILDAAITEFEMNKRFVELRNDLLAGKPASSIASASVDGDGLNSIRIALQQLATLNFTQVGEILGPTRQGLRGYLIREVSNAVASLQRMAAMLRDRKDPEDDAKLENDLNSAVREVLNASLAIVKWNVSDQSLGGYTAKGNPGERDLVIRAGGSEIAIYEALVCGGLDRKNIKKHLNKLPAYGYCDLYFNVIYSYLEEIRPLLEYVRTILEYEISLPLVFRRCDALIAADRGISGYVATYGIDHREVAIVFMIADLKIRIE
ncbi:hypothetical protein [Musicola keenii]|uniref:hypothetical protein n=1 Tax=Musicola keenii TaxID=2884250 RepID=UPI0017872F20|nr:hypothetical protein [Musicola keenii]